MKHLMQCEGLLDRRFVADIEKVMLVMINRPRSGRGRIEQKHKVQTLGDQYVIRDNMLSKNLRAGARATKRHNCNI